MSSSAQRVAARFIEGSRYYGFPDAPEAPVTEWDDLVKLLPKGIQKLFDEPEPEEEVERETSSSTMSASIDLNIDFDLDAGIDLSVRAWHTLDADEDGLQSITGTETSYTLFMDSHSWTASGKRYSDSKLTHDITAWSEAVRKANPEAAKRLGL